MESVAKSYRSAVVVSSKDASFERYSRSFAEDLSSSEKSEGASAEDSSLETVAAVGIALVVEDAGETGVVAVRDNSANEVYSMVDSRSKSKWTNIPDRRKCTLP